MNLAVSSLGFACLLIIALFFEVSLEIAFGFSGFAELVSKGWPLAPIGMIVVFVLLLPIAVYFNKRPLKVTTNVKREAILQMRGISKYYTVFFLVFCCVLFVIAMIMILVMNGIL